MPKFTAKQQRYVEEYLVDFNSTAAAQRAGYSPSRSTAARILKLPHVKAAIDAARVRMTEQTDVTVAEIVTGLLEIARAAESGAAPRVSAWTQLGRYKAMFVDKVESRVDINGKLNVTVVYEDKPDREEDDE